MSHETWNQSSAQDGDETGVWVVARCEKMPIIMQLVLAGTIHTMMCEIRCEGLNLARIMTLGKNGFKVKFLITWWQISISSWQMAKCRSADRFAITLRIRVLKPRPYKKFGGHRKTAVNVNPRWNERCYNGCLLYKKVLSKFKDSLFALNHCIIDLRSCFNK